MNPSNIVIDLNQVSFWRTERSILKKVNWQVNAGDHWIVFGPNGSGKTTLLKIITGYLFASEGEVKILGETVGKTDVFNLRKRIGWVSSSLESLVHDEDPVVEIIIAGKTAGTRLWSDPPKEDWYKAYDLLEQFRLNEIWKSPWEVLSQGERKKTLIARAMMNDPEILILDEPCEGLDIASKEQFLKDIAILGKNQKLTMLFVSHHVEEVLPMFDQILFLQNGQIFEKGEVKNLLNSEMLTKIFNMPVSIEKRKGRYITQGFAID